MNYDPNLVTCGRMTKQQVRLTFGTWDYRTTVETEASGNCLGFEVIDSAVLKVSEELNGVIFLENDSGILTCEFCQSDCSDEERWLKDMLISAEILAIKPEEDEYGNGKETSVSGKL